jgi:CDP-diacylglycerol--serine O-phosphatidyltransferase
VAGCFLFDYTDGMAARALGVSSPLGKELDSLSDVVSFGVVPGCMMYLLIERSLSGNGSAMVTPGALPAFAQSACAAMRLGKFNLDTRQTRYFIGLTTPASTVFVLGLFLTIHYDTFQLSQYLLRPALLYVLMLSLCFLMLSEIPMFGMKIKKNDWKSNRYNIIFASALLVLFLFLKSLALSVIVIIYIVASLASRKSIEAT